MPKAIVMRETGGPECLLWDDVEIGDPGPGEARIRQTAVGLNYIDVYVRTGAYPLLQLPGTPGMEAAGVVEAVGDGVTHIKPGDRVAYGTVLGAYAEERIAPADRLVPIADGGRGPGRGGDDAEGHDGGVPAASHHPGQTGRHHPDACGGPAASG